MSQINMTLIKKLSSLLEPFPVRIKAIHLVNPPKGIETMFKLFMSVCHEKLRSRIHMHENFDELQKHVDKQLLPIEYGGTNQSIPEVIDWWRKELLRSREWFLDDAKYRVDNLQSSSATDNNGSLFGAEGSFRSLNID